MGTQSENYCFIVHITHTYKSSPYMAFTPQQSFTFLSVFVLLSSTGVPNSHLKTQQCEWAEWTSIEGKSITGLNKTVYTLSLNTDDLTNSM